ncbi:MAG TPA: YfbM family protein [Pirellulaceae bacterium]|nr:YfbM family protein [Pirellulaceae bacterium]
MSMIANFVAVDPQQLAALVANPDLVPSFLHPEDAGAEPANYLDIDKAWHAIHFTLNGEELVGEGPLFLVVMGGEGIGDDVGYGPARYLTPAQVKVVAAAVAAIGPDAFNARFDLAALEAADVYPQIWEGDDPEAFEYVLSYYNQLSSFYQSAAKRGDAVLLYLN